MSEKKVLYQKKIPVTKQCDVLVAGAGPAGIAAAVSAAKMGAKTILLERYGAIGGNLTLGSVGPIMGGTAEGTFSRILCDKIKSTPVRHHDMEELKLLLLNALEEAGVEFYLQTVVTDVLMDGEKITGLVTAGKHGQEIFEAKTFIDATGDGDIAAFAGAEVMMGREEDGLLQPVSHMVLLGGVAEKAIYCNKEDCPVMLGDQRFVDFCIECNRDGRLPQNVSIVRLYPSIRKGCAMMNATQVNGINALNPKDVARAELLLHKQISQIMDFLHEYVPGYENCYIISTPATLGVRETRRIKGNYILSEEDLLEGRKFDDVIAHDVKFVVDIHNPSGGGQADGVAKKVKPYDIPYRCITPVGISNLLTAGRCISGTHRAHASYRVMNICMAVGEAAGVAGALSAQMGVDTHKLEVSILQKQLADWGINLFN